MYWKHLDGLTIPDVCWMPYGEHRGVQDYLAAAGQICLVPEQCASDYME